MTGPTFRLSMPDQSRGGVVFASPHSGNLYPPDFVAASQLDELALRSSEDAFVDDLFGDAPRHGAPLLAALAPRAYVDVNRAADELDPALIAGLQRSLQNPRINSGLGVIPRVVAGGRSIYRGKIPRREAEERLARVWHPYHDALRSLLARIHAASGEVVLIDCHSMPREALGAARSPARTRPDVVLGDRFGASASPEVTDRVDAAFKAAGFRVARNTPFAGAFIAQHYGRPSRGQHVVQVEIDRGLYMHEAELRPNADYMSVKAALTRVIAELAAAPGPGDTAMAAE